MKDFALKSLIVLSIFSLSSCTEYWRERGQPPSPQKLMQRAEQRLNDAMSKFSASPITADLVQIAELIHEVDSSIEGGGVRGVSTIAELITHMQKIEDSLSVPSRPAYTELTKQLLKLEQDLKLGNKVYDQAYKLLAARIQFFLANELEFAG